MGEVEPGTTLIRSLFMKVPHKSTISFLLFSLLWILGCNLTSGITPAAPTLPPRATSTPLSLPTVASVPQSSATSETLASTPEPSLRTDGPYFAYFQQQNLILRLVFVDADGRGRKVIELPKAISDAYAYGTLPAPDIRSVSPDGRWLAFYTGSAGNYGELPTQGTADLALNLLDLETGETQVIAQLLSKDYPNNFMEAAQKLNNPNITAESLFEAFTYGITQTIAWSPDGKYLAFGGQMDGLSSDLYLYEVETKKITRLSSGDQELQWINWSPDGKQIVHSSVYSVGAGMTFDIYAATVNGSSAPHISTNILYAGIDHWLNSHEYFENDGDNGPGEYGLRLVDIDTGAITKIWDGSFGSYAVDKTGVWVMLLANSPDTSPYNGGVFNFDPSFYLINLKTHTKSKVEIPDNTFVSSSIQPFGVAGQDFILRDQAANSPVFFSVNGTWTPTNLGDVQISVSPNSEYWLAAGEDLNIYSTDNTLVNTSVSPLPGQYIKLSWSPDSSSVFLISETEIYSLNISDGLSELIETNLMSGQGLYYTWVGGQ